MATKLEKDITRESSVLKEDKEVMVTLTADQKITMKLKGKRSGSVSIDIDELYDQLTGVDEKQEDDKPRKVGKDDMMISLEDLRSMNAVSGGNYTMTCHFDMLIKNLIDDRKKGK